MRLRRESLPAFLVAVLILLRTDLAFATAPSPGNLLITDASGAPTAKISEFTPAGVQVQAWTIPATAGFNSVRGIIQDGNGNVQAFNGTFQPVLTTLNTATGASTDNTLPVGWSSVARAGLGGLTAFGNWVYAADMNTAAPGTPNGIIRFDINTLASTRFAAGKDINWVTVGMDGMLYALNGGGTIETYDPNTMVMLKSTNFAANFYGIAVDSNGDVFGVQFDEFVYQFDKNGVFIKKLALTPPGNNFHNIAINSAGQIACVYYWAGSIHLTDRTLATSTKFTPFGGVLGPYLAWGGPPPSGAGPPPPPPPPPSAGGGPKSPGEGNYFNSSGPTGGEGGYGFGGGMLPTRRFPLLKGPFVDGPSLQSVRNLPQDSAMLTNVPPGSTATWMPIVIAFLAPASVIGLKWVRRA